MTFSLSRTRTARQTAGLPRVMAMIGVHKERRELAAMSDSRLRDLGITRQEATVEAARPFWDLPCTPRR